MNNIRELFYELIPINSCFWGGFLIKILAVEQTKKIINTMKTTVEHNNKEQEIKFPCLMVNEDKEIILYATERELRGTYKGIALKHPSDMWKNSISGAWDKTFKPFNGKITLEND